MPDVSDVSTSGVIVPLELYAGFQTSSTATNVAPTYADRSVPSELNICKLPPSKGVMSGIDVLICLKSVLDKQELSYETVIAVSSE